MISSSLLISLWALVGLPGQDMAAVRPPRPESANLWANPAVPSSEIPIPIEIEITDLVRLVEEHIPFGVLASETGNDGHSVRYAYTVSRDAPVTGSAEGNELVFRVPLRIDGNGTYTLCGGIWHHGRCRGANTSEHGNGSTTVAVELRVGLQIDSHYQIRANTYLKGDWAGDTHLHLNLIGDLIRIHIDVRDKLEGPFQKVIRDYQAQITEKAAALAESVHLREQLESYWKQLQQPIRAGSFHLQFHPTELQLENPSFHDGKARVVAVVRGTFTAMDQDQEGSASSLPEATILAAAGSRFRVHVPLRLPYSSLDERINQAPAAAGPEGDDTIRFGKVESRGVRLEKTNALLFALDFQASLDGALVEGELLYSGLPAVASGTKRLAIANLEPTPATRSALAAAGLPLDFVAAGAENIRRRLDSAFQLELGPYIFMANLLLEKAKIGDLQLRGQLTDAWIAGFLMNEASFDLIIAAEGSLEILPQLASR